MDSSCPWIGGRSVVLEVSNRKSPLIHAEDDDSCERKGGIFYFEYLAMMRGGSLVAVCVSWTVGAQYCAVRTFRGIGKQLFNVSAFKSKQELKDLRDTRFGGFSRKFLPSHDSCMDL